MFVYLSMCIPFSIWREDAITAIYCAQEEAIFIIRIVFVIIIIMIISSMIIIVIVMFACYY